MNCVQRRRRAARRKNPQVMSAMRFNKLVHGAVLRLREMLSEISIRYMKHLSVLGAGSALKKIYFYSAQIYISDSITIPKMYHLFSMMRVCVCVNAKKKMSALLNKKKMVKILYYIYMVYTRPRITYNC